MRNTSLRNKYAFLSVGNSYGYRGFNFLFVAILKRHCFLCSLPQAEGQRREGFVSIMGYKPYKP